MKSIQNYYGSKSKFIGSLIFSIIILAMCISTFLQPQENLSLKDQVAAWFGTPIFSIIIIVNIFFLLNQKPSIVINEINLIVLGFPPLKWEEIASVYIFESSNNKFLGVVLKDQNSFINKLSPLRRSSANIAKKRDWPLVSIGQIMISEPIEKVLSEIELRLNALHT